MVTRVLLLWGFLDSMRFMRISMPVFMVLLMLGFYAALR